MKTLPELLNELIREYPESNRRLIYQQAQALQDQYRNEQGVYTNKKGLLRQETFAYLVIKGNLAKGLYQQRKV